MDWTLITSIFLLTFFGFPGIGKQRRQMLDELIQSRRIAQGFVADSEALSLEIKSSSNTLFVSLFIAGNHFLLASLAAWRYTWGHMLPQRQDPGLTKPVPSVQRTSLFFWWGGAVSHGMRDPISLTRDQTHAPCSEWKQCRVPTTGPPGNSLALLLLRVFPDDILTGGE